MTTESGVTTQSEETHDEAPPGTTAPPEGKTTRTKNSSRASQAGRRIGYVIAVIINLAMLYLINVMPGWTAIDVLTVEFTAVLWIMNLTMILSVAANLAYLAYDSTWFRASCEFTLAAMNLIIAIRTYQVFPFNFTTFAFNWTVLARLIIVLVMIGSLIAIVVNAVRLLIAIASGTPPERAPSERT